MNSPDNFMKRNTHALILPLLLLLANVSPMTQAQDMTLRAGIHAGMQSSILRYSLPPYTGNFQATMDEGLLPAISALLDIDDRWSLQLDVEWKSDGLTELRGEDPKIRMNLARRTTVLLPLMLRYRVPSASVPLFASAGAALSITPDAGKRMTVEYTGFTEREGWHTFSTALDQNAVQFNAVVESGLDLQLTSALSFILAVRYQHPFTDLVDTERMRAGTLSIWRIRAGLYIAL
jgi:hypothetical protein